MRTFKTLQLGVLSAAMSLLSSNGFCQDVQPTYYEAPLFIGEMFLPSTSQVDVQSINVPGQAGESPTLSDQRESGRFIVSRSTTDTWAVNERFGHFGIGQSLAIPETSTVIPRDLWSLDMGGAYNHRLANGRELGLTLNVGSDSDELFHSIHETVLRVSGFYRIPSGTTNAWILALNYSNNRHFLNGIPLPGVAYAFQADDHRLQGVVGFPFMALRYKPTPDWTLQGSIFGPRNLSAEIARRIMGPVRAFTAFEWGSQEWLIADRQDYSDRLVFDRKRAVLGFRSPLAKGLQLQVSGGRQFDQRFFVNSSSSHRDVPTLGLSPAWVVDAKLSFRFGS